MKSSHVILSLLSSVVLLAHTNAEARRAPHKLPAGWAVASTLSLKVSDVRTPDLDQFPAPRHRLRDVPMVGSPSSVALVHGLSTSLGARVEDSTAVQTPMAPVQVASRGRVRGKSTDAVRESTRGADRVPTVAALSAPADAADRFDLVVNNAPASQVFLQLGGHGTYNVLVPPDLSGSISVALRNTTVMEALESLKELYGYDFRVAGNRVYVYPNAVQTRLFKVNYLPGRRLGVSDLRVQSSSIVQTSGGSSSGGATSGSTGSANAGKSATALEMSAVSTTSDTDFWRDVKDSLNSLVNVNKGGAVTLNPGAGVIVVRGTPAELRQVGDYLRAVQLTIERQVMLEAKIVEVELSEDTQTGINWSLFRGIQSGNNKVGLVGAAPGVSLSHTGTLSNGSGSTLPGASVVAEDLGKGFYGLAVQGANFTALLSFLETQGNVQVLSSPRIAALNNQKAVLKVGTDELFLTNVKNSSTSTASGTTNAPELTLQPFFSGISLDVTPQIDDKGAVMLHVHPAISVVTEKQKTFDLGGDTVLRLPLATSSINETDSVVRVLDGQIVAIGGLMQQTGSRLQSGLPVLGQLPVVGNAFGQKSKAIYKRELVILIKPTVINGDGTGWSDAQPDTALLNR